MVRRIAAATVGVLCFAMVGLAAAANVTYVLNNGERHSGQLVYHKDLNLGLVENGSEQSFPISEVAAIIYNDGDPSARELDQLPTSDNPPGTGASHSRAPQRPRAPRQGVSLNRTKSFCSIRPPAAALITQATSPACI